MVCGGRGRALAWKWTRGSSGELMLNSLARVSHWRGSGKVVGGISSACMACSLSDVNASYACFSICFVTLSCLFANVDSTLYTHLRMR